MEESSANMEMIATESENISKGTEGEGETVKFDDVQKSSRIDADQQVINSSTNIDFNINLFFAHQAMESVKSTGLLVGALLVCYFPLIGQLSANQHPS